MLKYPVTVVVCLGLIAAAVAWGRWLRERDGSSGGWRERRLRGTLAWGTIGVWVVMNIWYIANRGLEESLPLHICDLAAVIGPIGLLSRSRLLRSVLYFWGLALTTQGFATPVLNVGPGHMTYWLFWANHTIVVGLAVYDIVVGGYRPYPRDLGRVVGVTAGWLALVFTINYFTGWNYGYVGRAEPGAETIVQALGPWPLRVVWMALLALAAFGLAYLPWVVARRAARSGGAGGDAEASTRHMRAGR